MNITSGQTGITEEREDEKGARLHLIGFLILCDDAAQAVVSNCSLFSRGSIFPYYILKSDFFSYISSHFVA